MHMHPAASKKQTFIVLEAGLARRALEADHASVSQAPDKHSHGHLRSCPVGLGRLRPRAVLD